MINVQLNGQDNLTVTSTYGTIGTTAAAALASVVPVSPGGAPNLRHMLEIVNPNATALLAYTLDGSTPVVNGAGATIPPQSTRLYTIAVPQGAVNVIGNSASTLYTINVL